MSVYGEGQVPAAPVAVVAPRTKRYWSRSGLLYVIMVTLLMALALGIWSTWTSADAWANGTWAQSTRFFMYTGLAWGLFFIAFSGPFLVLILRPRITFRAGTLRIPRGAFHTTRIAVGDVTGIGLSFRQVRSAAGLGVGWYLTVWRGPGAGEQTGISYVPMLLRLRGPAAAQKLLAVSTALSADVHGRDFTLGRFDPAAQTDVARLASTHPGRVARDLYQRIVALQGPGGLLAATEQQKHMHPSDRRALSTVQAVWSPDGVMTRPAG
jgi:hypothetical protein